MTKTGAQILWECLEREGVKHVFGYPGGAILPAYDALKHSDIHHILVRHEQGATHMADGYARASGDVGVAVATSGPGATNMVTGIATAMLDSSPIVCITGQVGSKLIGSDAFQETDITGITLPITKHNYLVTHASELAQVLREAFYVARSGRPGPVLVDITKDAQQSSCEFDWEAARPQLPGYRPDLSPEESEYAQALELIHKAKRPLILAGHGIIVSGAMAEVLTLAEKAGIPVALTLLGIGAFPASHPLNLGMMGMHGEAWVNHAIQEADLLLALGMRFDDRVTGNLKTYAQDAKKIHIEIDPAEINKNVKVDVALVGDLREVLKELLPRVKSVDHTEWLDSIDKLKGDSAVRDVQKLPDNGHLYAAHVINDLWRETRNSNTVVVTDVGQHQMWEAQYFKHEKPRSLITSGGLGTMGFALPAAIGAKVARPDAEVWVIVGDGGFQMTMSRTRDHSAGKAEDQHCHHQQRIPGHGAPVAGIFLRAQLRGHAAAESQFRETGGGVRHPQHGRDRALAGAADSAGGARARRRRADRLQGRAGRHRVPDGRGRGVFERHDPAAQSHRRNRRGQNKGKNAEHTLWCTSKISRAC